VATIEFCSGPGIRRVIPDERPAGGHSSHTSEPSAEPQCPGLAGGSAVVQTPTDREDLLCSGPAQSDRTEFRPSSCDRSAKSCEANPIKPLNVCPGQSSHFYAPLPRLARDMQLISSTRDSRQDARHATTVCWQDPAITQSAESIRRHGLPLRTRTQRIHSVFWCWATAYEECTGRQSPAQAPVPGGQAIDGGPGQRPVSCCTPEIWSYQVGSK